MEDLTLENSYKKYWSTVKAIAEEVKEEIQRDNTLDLYELQHQYVDGSEWIIYYWQQKLVLLHTDNLEACEELGELPNTPNDAIQTIAFWAMLQDVRDRYERLED